MADTGSKFERPGHIALGYVHRFPEVETQCEARRKRRAGVKPQRLEQPRYYWDPVIAPSGLVFYQGDLFRQWKSSVLVGGLAGQAMFRLELGKDDKVVNEEPLLTDLNERIRDVRVFQDGAVYVLTDGAGGKLLKLTPK